MKMIFRVAVDDFEKKSRTNKGFIFSFSLIHSLYFNINGTYHPSQTSICWGSHFYKSLNSYAEGWKKPQYM